MLPRTLGDHMAMKAASQSNASRFDRRLSILIHCYLLVGPFLNLHKLPLFKPLLTIAIGVGFVILSKKLLTFKRWNDEKQHLRKFILSLTGLILVVLTENFCTWATSASDRFKYNYQPLQDNGEILIHALFQRIPLLKAIVMGWRVDMHWLLYSFISLCVSVAWDVVPYSGFAIGSRLMDVIAWSHAIRTVAFMVTVLPNPRLGCYAANFPPVPNSAWEFIKIGFGAKRGHGCNDLVISGHGVVYAAAALAIQTYYPVSFRRGGPAVLAWVAVFKLCLQEVVDKTHYSVDMLLAVVVTILVWEWRKDLYPTSAMWKLRRATAPSDPVPVRLIGLVIAALTIVFVGIIGV